MLFENLYVWFIFVSSLDIMLTAVVLSFGGREVNGLAAVALNRFGLPGMVVFKFLLVTFVICICEIVGQKAPKTGRRLAEWAVALTCVPLVLALVQIFRH